MIAELMLAGACFCFQDGQVFQEEQPVAEPRSVADPSRPASRGSGRSGRPEGDVRLHVGFNPTYASLVGRLEKEDVSAGIGSGWKLSLGHDHRRNRWNHCGGHRNL